MRPENIKLVKQMQGDFSKLKKKKILNAADEEALVQDLTGLLGIYDVEFNKELMLLIDKILAFAEEHELAMQGTRMEFERINALHKSKGIKVE